MEISTAPPGRGCASGLRAWRESSHGTKRRATSDCFHRECRPRKEVRYDAPAQSVYTHRVSSTPHTADGRQHTLLVSLTTLCRSVSWQQGCGRSVRTSCSLRAHAPHKTVRRLGSDSRGRSMVALVSLAFILAPFPRLRPCPCKP